MFVALTIAWSTLTAVPASSTPHPAEAPNPIVRENRHPGTDRWDIPWPGYKITDDRRLKIKGYATEVSVLQGGSIDLRVTTQLHEPYTVDVYRLGYYQGHGGRHIERLGPFDGAPQPACITLPYSGMVTCPWHTSVTLAVPSSWTSGVYLAVLSTQRTHFQSEIPFTVRDTRPADVLYVTPVNTYQAYNNYPYDPPPGMGWNSGAYPLTGRSLYDYNSPLAPRLSGRQARLQGLLRPAVQLAVREPGQRRTHGLRAVHDRVPGEARVRRLVHHRRR